MRIDMALTFGTRAKTQGVLINIEAEIGQAIDYIIQKKGCTRDEFIKESIFRNINYFMQHEDQTEKAYEFDKPEVRTAESRPAAKPKRKARTKKK